MILTFRELEISTDDYHWVSPQHRDALIINQACDYIMAKFFPRQSEDWAIPHPENARVDMGSRTVRVPTAYIPLH